jgi:hypothetical protein
MSFKQISIALFSERESSKEDKLQGDRTEVKGNSSFLVM